MKTPPRPAPRILLLVIASIITLAVLLLAIAGWWASAAKADALRTMEDRGRITSVTDIPRPLPRDDRNFAMLPMLVELREESATTPPDDGWTAKLEALGQDRHGQTIRTAKRGQPFDLEKLLDRHDLPGNPAEALREFDRRHATVLAQFRAGLGLPHATRPRTMDFSDPSIYFTATTADSMALHRTAAGLVFRAELAVAAVDPGTALESLLIAGRLSELITSDETLLAVLISVSIDSSRASVLARGIESRLWDENQLLSLQQSWLPRDDRAALSRVINIEGFVAASYFGHAKRNRKLMLEMWTTTPGSPARRLLWHLVPGSWFDAQAAETLKTTEAWLHRLETPGPMQPLWETSRRELAQTAPSDWIGIGRAAPILVQKFVRHAVLAEQARLALRLARHRLAHGKYPPDLVDLGGAPPADPLTGNPFLYRSDGDTFTLHSPGPDGIDNGAVRPRPDAGWDDTGADWVW